MIRLSFDVRPVDDAWEVQADNALPGDLPARFDTQAEAVAIATTLARAVWRGTRRPTGVRVLLENEDWRDVLRCGGDEEDLQSAGSPTSTATHTLRARQDG